MLATTEKRLEIKQFTYKEDIDLSRWHECIEKIVRSTVCSIQPGLER